jgi:UDP-glucose 4-epimerase
MERMIEGKGTEPVEVFNLGTGKGSTVVEVIAAFERATGKKLQWEFAPRRPGDVIAAYADTQKAAQVLGWKAERTLDQSMADAWRWQQSLPKTTAK